jgi:hypothetical protein
VGGCSAAVWLMAGALGVLALDMSDIIVLRIPTP